jgi:hypothetical protein
VTLEVGERINCRCFITYHNSPDAKISTRTIIAPPARPSVVTAAPVAPEPPRPTLTAAAPPPPKIPTTPRERFTAGKTVEETKQNFETSFKGFAKAEKSLFFIDEKVTKSSLEGYGELFSRYKVFEGFDLRILSATLGSQRVGEFGSTVPNSPFILKRFKSQNIQEIRFNFDKFKTEKDVEKRQIDDQNINWKMKVDEENTVRYTAEHELGHYIHLKVLTERHYLVRTEKGQKLKEEYDNQWKTLQNFEEKQIGSVLEYNRAGKRMKTLSKKIATDSAKYYTDIAIERAMKEDGVDKKDKKVYVDNRTSEYGQTNTKEFIAEHWAAYRLNSKPNPISKNLGKLFEELLEEVSDE